MDAVDDLSDAIDATRALLTPVKAWMWLKLSFVVLFVVGISAGGPTLPGGDLGTFAEDPNTQFGPDTALEELPEDFWLYVAIVVGLFLVLWLLFAFIGAVMEFVFIESLRTTEVHVRRYARDHLGRGVRLFGFRLLLRFLAVSIVSAPAAYVFLTTGSVESVADRSLLIGLLSIPVYGLYAIVMRFTSEFVAPIMLLEERGVLSSWQRFWGTATSNWAEYVVYLLLAWIILAVVQLGLGFVLVFGGLLIAIPFVILGILAFLLGEVGLILLFPIGLIALSAFLVFYGVVWMPVRSYFQYYALLLLGDTNAEFDLIPEQRAAIRSDGGEPTDRADDSRIDGSDDHATWDEPNRSDPWDDANDSAETDTSGPWDDANDSDDRDDADRGW